MIMGNVMPAGGVALAVMSVHDGADAPCGPEDLSAESVTHPPVGIDHPTVIPDEK